jgi:hypothetical protein
MAVDQKDGDGHEDRGNRKEEPDDHKTRPERTGENLGHLAHKIKAILLLGKRQDRSESRCPLAEGKQFVLPLLAPRHPLAERPLAGRRDGPLCGRGRAWQGSGDIHVPFPNRLTIMKCQLARPDKIAGGSCAEMGQRQSHVI